MSKPTIILASVSRARNEMLRNAGLDFTAQPADIDETSIISAASSQTPEHIANKLAQEKALHVSAQNPDALVIGGDTILECDGQIFEKVADQGAAKEKLQFLRGKTHRLISATAIAQNNKILWHVYDDAHMDMRDFDDDFIDAYIARAGDDVTRCVGTYALEKAGIWLFSKIDGSYHTIMGMPLLPVLGYLREEWGLRP